MHHRVEISVYDLKMMVVFTFTDDSLSASAAYLAAKNEMPQVREKISKGNTVGEVTLSAVLRKPSALWRAYPLWWTDHPRWFEAPFCGEKSKDSPYEIDQNGR